MFVSVPQLNSSFQGSRCKGGTARCILLVTSNSVRLTLCTVTRRECYHYFAVLQLLGFKTVISLTDVSASMCDKLSSTRCDVQQSSVTVQ